MEKAADDIKDWLTSVGADPPTTVAAATNQAVDALCDKVASAIVNALHRNGYHWSPADHVLCDFLAAAARAMQTFRDQFQHQVEHIVSTILASRREQKRQGIPEPVVRVAAQAAVNALMKLSPAREFDDLLRAMRILAVATCPAPEQHRSVAIDCLAPLETGVLSSAMKQELVDHPIWRLRPTIRSVGVGKSSRAVRHRSWAGPVFQSCPRASGAVRRLGYSLGYSRGGAALILGRPLFRPDMAAL